MNEKIELTSNELEELKDDIKFRTKVLIELKSLNGVPKKVTILETKINLHFWLIGLIVSGILVLAFRVMAK